MNREEDSHMDNTNGDLGQNNKRKERVDTYTGEQTEFFFGFNVKDQKKKKFIHGDDLQNKALEAVSNMEIKKNGEGNEENETKLTRIIEELEDFPDFEYEFNNLEFLSLELLDHHQISLSPQESSNKNVAAQPQMQTHVPSDEPEMLDGISLSDLANDLQEGQSSKSDLEKEENQDRLDEIFNDLAKVLKP